MSENNPNDQWTNAETKDVAHLIETKIKEDEDFENFWNYSPVKQNQILTDIINNLELEPYLSPNYQGTVQDLNINWDEVRNYIIKDNENQWTNVETKQVALIIENNLIPVDFWDNSPEKQKTILSDIFNSFDLENHLPDVDEFKVNWFEVCRYLNDTFLEPDKSW